MLTHWDKLDDEKRRELLGRASHNQDDLARLVDQLLDFARIDADRVQIDLRSCSLARCVDDAVTDLAPVLAGHKLEIDVDPTVRVHADLAAIRRILTNLLTNTVKFSPRASTVRLEAVSRDEEVLVSVADEGIGIAPNDHEQACSTRSFRRRTRRFRVAVPASDSRSRAGSSRRTVVESG